MARTCSASFSSRGESYRGESSREESSAQGEARRKPTAYARRSRATPIQDDPIAEERAFEEQAYKAYETHGQEETFKAPNDDDDEEEHANVPEIQEDVGGFAGSPRDGSLLTHYVQHVAYAISMDRDQGDMLMLISHGKKVNKLGPCHEGIQHIVLNSSLMPLIEICYDYVDKGLLLEFIERLHFETNSFHHPIGEMSVTHNDVSTLLHLPVMGQMCDLEDLEFEEARTALMELMGVDGDITGAEMEKARETYTRVADLPRALLHSPICTRAQGCESRLDEVDGRKFDSVSVFQPLSMKPHRVPLGGRALGRVPLSRDSVIVGCADIQWSCMHLYKGHRGIQPFFSICMYSDPYIIAAIDDARPALAPRQRFDVPQEADPIARFRRMARMLQSLISCHHVTEGTIAHQVSVDLLQIANEGIDEYSPTRRGQRLVCGRRSTSI
ncbi:hypothetical protein LR48_Vigan148s001400 [Vigna angularis]|uniref:Aminotransferase-like plant mobile domain-containing protein n=1 Tax=Phaseolus angularis TaxID=3914 RepID=A0A0L9T4X1_PHAAN|nr:hypothetical protein LR48_Vigan148s001400 [Vigna angularis]